jgi:hypothetical protein
MVQSQQNTKTENFCPAWSAEVSRMQDVMGKSTDALEGYRCQNTLKNKRLEHRSCRQEESFIDRKRRSGETHSGI